MDKKMTGKPKRRRGAPSGGFRRALIDRWQVPAAMLLIVAVGIVVYYNSFGGAFVLDDEVSIVRNPQVRKLWPLWDAVKGNRPLVNLSLSLDFRLDKLWARHTGRRDPPPGLGVWRYHAFNVTVHILAALTLFGVVWRTLTGRALRQRFGQAAVPLSLAVALLWMVHPLQTGAVTYVIQRAESMMGMFFLLTLYCAIRGFASRRFVVWYVAAGVACALGMLSKEVMVVAPLIVLAYDWIFVSRSLRGVFQRHWGLYSGLAASWLILAWVLLSAPVLEAFGFGIRTTPLVYAATQLGVILHYLRLTFWPSGLCLDHWLLPAETVGRILPGALVVGGLLAATVVALWRKPVLGFCGVWFFLILAPTSSIMPLSDLIFEHRMYLPLAAVAALFVCLAYFYGKMLLHRQVASEPLRRPLGTLMGGAAIIGASVALGSATIARNRVYRSEEAVWRDVIQKVSHNPRAHNNLGKALYMSGRVVESIPWYNEALKLKADYADPHYNLGLSHADLGKPLVAIEEYKKAIEINPKFSLAYGNLGLVLDRMGRHAEACKYYRDAIRVSPEYGMAYNNLGVSLMKQGKTDEAAENLSKAVELEPEYIAARNNLALLYIKQGKTAEAIAELRKTIEIEPKFAEGHFQLGSLLARQGDVEGAIAHLRQAVAAVPDHAPAYLNLGVLHARQGKLDEAIRAYREAVRCQPRYVQAHLNLGQALQAKGDVEAAIRHLSEAVRLKPDFAGAHNAMGKAMAAAGNRDGAVRYYTQAIAYKSDFAEAHNNLGVVLIQQGKWDLAAAYYNTALRIAPGYVVAMHNLARLRATCPEPGARNGAEAVRLAEQVCRATENKQAAFLDTLGAAYAEAGRFDDAVRTMRLAMQLASQAEDAEMVAAYRMRLTLYQGERPLRESPRQ